MPDRNHPLLGASASRRQILRGAGIGVATLAFGSALSACGGGNDSSSSGKTKMTYQLEWLKITQFAGFFAAQENGYYTKNAVDPTIDAGGPNISASQLVAAGRADLGDDDNITLLQGIAKGLPLVMFATVFQKTPYSCISKSSKPIHTLQDMVGKTIAISAAGKAQLTPALQNAGVDPSKVKIIPAGADPTQLVTGQADGYFGFSTDQGVSLEQKGLDVVFASATDLGFGGYADCLFATKDKISQDKDNLVDFLRGTIMGYEWSNANPAKAAELVVNKYGPKGQNLALQTEVAKKQVSLIESPKGVMWMDVDQMQKIIDDQVAIKVITKPMKAEDVMTTSILEAAYGGKTSLLNG
jgi:NitT/TauT family transport system substrate-binding protein